MMVGMHAIEVARTGGPDVLQYLERDRPEPGPGEVLIKAEAIGVNFIGGYSALVQKGFGPGDRELIESIPRALA